MSILDQNKQPFEPYARLMNIIGDQLITDKKVAVIEIVKNSYDADAENVQVRFFNMKNYGHDYLPEEEQPYIEIEDDGDGMTLDIVKNVWLKPATPNKFDKKNKKNNFSKKGRIIQGEKGIGRFAIHKLGEKIEVFTKAKGDNEVKIEMDFSEYNPEKANLFNQNIDYKLLSEVDNYWFVNNPPEVIKKDKGTLIKIQNLREKWNEKDFIELYKSIQRLIPPIDENAERLGIKHVKDFDVNLFIDNEAKTFEDVTTFKDVIERAQFKMFGEVDENGVLNFTYKCSSPNNVIENRKIDLLNLNDLSKYNYPTKIINDHFIKHERRPKCGKFVFTFYAFNLSKPDKLILNKDVKEFIKQNFVYVLRDGVRVYPFGEPGYDWLDLDKLRSTQKAGDFISYNDLTGFVYLSQDENPFLKDSSNRQGIMNIDGAFDDFKNLTTQITQILHWEKKIDQEKLKIKENESFKKSNDQLLNSFNSLKSSLDKIDNREVLEKANNFLDTVNKHNDLMKDRMQTVEDLAGLGMAVEKASHDSLTLLSKMRGNVLDFKKKAKNKAYSDTELLNLLEELDENLNFIYDEMQIIQPLFKNQRKAIKPISVFETIEKVVKYFRRDLDDKIKITIIKDNDIIINTNTGLILQIFINLLDNAIYWVNRNGNDNKEINIKINSSDKTIILADNGPGIREDIIPMVFNEFFSLKTDGRGLGLYIVKEILLRIDGEIAVIEEDRDRINQGANFIIKFS